MLFNPLVPSCCDRKTYSISWGSLPDVIWNPKLKIYKLIDIKTFEQFVIYRVKAFVEVWELMGWLSEPKTVHIIVDFSLFHCSFQEINNMWLNYFLNTVPSDMYFTN